MYGEESTELAQLEALLTNDSQHVGGAGVRFNDAIEAVDYDIHLARFQFSMSSHHPLDGEQNFRPGGEAQ